MNKKFVLASIDILLYIVLSMILDIFMYTLYGYNLYLFIFIGIQVLIWLLSIISYFSKHSIIYNIGIFIVFLVNIVSIYYIYNYNRDYSLIDAIVFNKYEYKDYYLYVKKGTTYSSYKDLLDKNIGFMDENYDNVCKELSNKININCKKYYIFEDLMKELNDADIQGVVVTNLHSESNLINSDYRKIYSFRVKCEK